MISYRVWAACLLLLAGGQSIATSTPKPNIVVILADDLGYGDLRSYNAESKIPTPHLDRLAADGLRFTDAHSPSAVCTPTRYGLLTGRYAWRTWLKDGVLDGFDPPLIAAGRPTLASFLQAQGYVTACIGKWHLGMTWTGKDGQPIPFRGPARFRPGTDVDFTREIQDGPLDRGFDVYFGIAASLDMSPYAFIDGRRVVDPAVEPSPKSGTLFLNQNAGMKSPGFELENVLPTIAGRAVRFIESQAQAGTPFFLYLPLNSPHLPVVPGSAWRDRSGTGMYGDFVAQTDAEIGRVLKALNQANLTENTLIVFASDNGGLWHAWEPREQDDLAGYKVPDRARYNAEHGHHSNGPLRGTKADIYEGGHRVPFIVRWPAVVKPATVSDALIELNDVFATVAELTGTPLPVAAAEDSFSFAPELTGAAPCGARRTFAVHHSVRGVFALREGPWKMIQQRGSGGFSMPRAVKPGPGEPVGQLYHLDDDPAETNNVWSEHPEVVTRLSGILTAVQAEE